MRPAVRLLRMLGPDGVRRLADCPENAWPAVIALAEQERLLATLGSVAVNGGLVPPVPAGLATVIAAQGRRPAAPLQLLAQAHALNQLRTADLLEQLDLALGTLTAAGIAVVPLKGAALLRRGSWPDPAAREMTDLDLLVLKPAAAADAQQVLIERGYREPGTGEYQAHPLLPDHHQLLPLRLPGRAGSIELHRTLMPDEWEWVRPTPQVVAAVVETADGPELAIVDLARHIIAHACFSDRALERHTLATRATLDLGRLIADQPDLPTMLRALELSTLERRAVERMVAGAEWIWATPATSRRSGRTRWAVSVWLADSPRLHSAVSQAALLPVFLNRERMSARAGRPLSGLDLQRYRLRATLSRAGVALVSIRQGRDRID